MSRAVQLDEESMVRAIVKAQELPPGVKLKRVEQSSDWEGNPALRIYFTTSMAIKLSPKRLRALSHLVSAVQDAILRSEIEKWPFIKFLEAK